MSEPKTAVPKFTSFRPKPTIPIQEKDEAEKNSERRHHSRGKDETDGKDHRWPHYERRRSRSLGRSPVRETKTKPSWIQPKAEFVGPFVVDKTGDEKNLVYGSIHRYNVPLFHRFGAGHVLGAPPTTKIDRDYGDEKGIVLSNWRDSRPGFREKYIFSKLERKKPRLLKTRPEVESEGHELVEVDFVPLQGPRKRNRKRGGFGGADNSGSDYDQRDYRSIYGKIKAENQPPDDDLQYATESDSSGSEAGRTMRVDASVRERNVELSRKVEEFPHDLEAWTALINHQDALIRAGGDRRRITNAEIRSTADIKIHMYEKALDKVRTLEDREKLVLGLMKEGEKVWETKALAERWEQISQDNIESLLLWSNYLNFKQTIFSSFRHEEVKGLFIQRLNILLKAARRSGDTDSFYQQIIYLLLRFSLFLRESGYSELAVSIWQGLLEMNFFSPKSPLSQAEAIKQFNDFWESEVPRVGEDGALGWRHFMEYPSASKVPDALVDEDGDAVNNMDLFKTWATAERLRIKGSRIPARTMDEVVEDDPFRVILFSDIENFLIILPPQSRDLRRLLLDGFLIFCRLPPVGAFDLEASKKWLKDNFVRDDLLEYDVDWIKKEFFPAASGESEEIEVLASSNVPIPCFSTSSEVLFGLNLLFKESSWKDKYSGGENGPVSYKWIRNTLKQITETCFAEDVAEYHLAFEFLNEPETIKKISKSILKQHPTSLRLYNSYALIEWSRGNKDTAGGVFSAALNLRGSLSEAEWDRDSILLWRSWIWASLADRDHDTALQHLLCIADGTLNTDATLSPTAILKTRQHLTSNRDHLISFGSSRSSVAYAECLMLFDYLTMNSGNETRCKIQGDISSALDSCVSFSRTLISRNLIEDTSHELFLQSTARLLFHHARIGPFRPALIREHLTRFLGLFPRNTMFLSLYTWNESRLRIDNRVRNILLSTVLTPENDTLTSRLFAIQYEMKHGTIHSARSAFENALSSTASKSSAGLWRFYIFFCLETPALLSRAKDVWYRALRACPWAKELYMIGFEKMSEMQPFAELKSTWRIMGEKELRVHVDLEEIFDDIGEPEKISREHRSLGYR